MKLWRKGIPIGSLSYEAYFVTAAEMLELSPDEPDAEALTDTQACKFYFLDTITKARFPAALLHEIFHAGLDAGAITTMLGALAGKKWNEQQEEILVRSFESVMGPALLATGWRPRR